MNFPLGGFYVRGMRKLWYLALSKRHKRDKISVLSELAEYYRLDETEILQKLQNGAWLVAREWNKVGPQSHDAILVFYASCQNYTFDLADWNYFRRDVWLTKEMIASRARGRVLDYGAGIGDMAIRLWRHGIRDITHYDIEGNTMRFASWRFARRRVTVNLLPADDYVDRLRGKYDTILCFDTIGHLLDPSAHIARLVTHLAKEGSIYINADFDKTNKHPLHLGSPLPLDEMLLRLGVRRNLDPFNMVFSIGIQQWKRSSINDQES